MEATGFCFAEAFESFMDRPDRDDWMLCHGVCIGAGPIEGLRFVHAWLESRDGLIVQDASGKVLPKVLYYAAGRIGDEVQRYTWKQVLQHVTRSGHSGPWYEFQDVTWGCED